LNLQRYGGTDNQDVVVTINFNHPVIPSFSISGIDGYASSYEQVEIYGSCSGNNYSPVLSYAVPQQTASYTIRGNTATAKYSTYYSASAPRSLLNVAFQGGITSITIKYRAVGRSYSVLRSISISPITLKMLPPAPPVNEDGLSFVKDVAESEITTCDPVKYTFYLQNTNCVPKTVMFRDSLPGNMTWQSFGLDDYSNDFNTDLKSNKYANTRYLQLDSLVIPSSTTLRISAIAMLDANAPSGEYANGAFIEYEHVRNNVPSHVIFASVDRYTLDSLTTFYAEWQQRADTVKITPSFNPSSYSVNGNIVVTYTINNPNPDISQMFFTATLDPGFTYVTGSLSVTPTGSVPAVLVTPSADPSALQLAGSANGTTGFTLPTGTTVIKFTIKAPALADLPYDTDPVTGLPTKNVSALGIGYDLWSESGDPCLTDALKDANGFNLIPYSLLNHIITNKHLTSK